MIIDFYVKSINGVVSCNEDAKMRINLLIGPKTTDVVLDVNGTQLNLTWEKLCLMEELIKSARRQEGNQRKVLNKQNKEIITK